MTSLHLQVPRSQKRGGPSSLPKDEKESQPSKKLTGNCVNKSFWRKQMNKES